MAVPQRLTFTMRGTSPRNKPLGPSSSSSCLAVVENVGLAAPVKRSATCAVRGTEDYFEPCKAHSAHHRRSADMRIAEVLVDAKTSIAGHWTGNSASRRCHQAALQATASSWEGELVALKPWQCVLRNCDTDMLSCSFNALTCQGWLGQESTHTRTQGPKYHNSCIQQCNGEA